ncbi:MAG: type III toxin-antitoxin system ToxN/AbiQ family toxin [Agathobacter sp.]|uniref:type III toxin-antitoxin system ToxN/AbiQ family toxin n=1 Tax=Agathobacter sp. TaxID=2021311 RepID=UPI00258FD911|nr:type III toxin-antitoxin system ToxN/AbiQ family toxin [Agathobacter sp.]MCR5677706.1 type III toxin-antitoxin system ToxN/AbiQ family toxin [Agathobacter sp.]
MLAPFVLCRPIISMKKSFYYVDAEYIQYLKEIELIISVFTCVPNMEYHNNDKFLYGMSVNEVDYYVPFSHYDRQQEDNILIKVDYHKKIKVAGSLRFNYMIPVPKSCLIPVDFSNFSEDRKVLLRKEYKSCLASLSKIQRKALKTYERVTNGNNDELTRNSCMFLELEEACKKYEK